VNYETWWVSIIGHISWIRHDSKCSETIKLRLIKLITDITRADPLQCYFHFLQSINQSIN